MSKERADKQLRQACEVLQHYHADHTDDAITRFSHSSGGSIDIYLISDPFWKAKFLKVFQDSTAGTDQKQADAQTHTQVANTKT